MKNINTFEILNKTVDSGSQAVECFISGDIGSYCHLHILDNSSPTKLGEIAQMLVIKRKSKYFLCLLIGKYRFNNGIGSQFLFADEMSHFPLIFFQIIWITKKGEKLDEIF